MAAQAKRGRPRQSGARYPSGKLKPVQEPMSGVLWQRLKQHGRQLGLDPRLLTELGRLNWFGELTVAQTAAGHRIAGIYGRYEHFKKLRRSARSPSYEQGFGEAGVAEELIGPDALAERESRIRDATAKFVELVGVDHPDSPTPGLIPRSLRGPVETLCVEDCSISPVLYEPVRQLLQRLAVHWRMTPGVAPRQQAQSPSSKALRHAPLHFNRHQDAAESAAPQAQQQRRPNLDRIFWMTVAKKLRPDLSEDALGGAYDIQQALKQREIFRRAKARRSGSVIPYDRG